MYEEYRSDPQSVSQSWQEFFADYASRPRDAPPSRPEATGPPPGALRGRPRAAPAPAPAPTAVPVACEYPVARPCPRRGRRSGAGADADAEPAPVLLRGAAARIAREHGGVAGVPTATSVRTVPAKLLEVNRSILNQHLARTSGAKVSFTHLIGYAVVQALQAVPALNAPSSTTIDDKGTRRRGAPRARRSGTGRGRGEVRRDPDVARPGRPPGRGSRLPGLRASPTRIWSARCTPRRWRPTTSPGPP